MQLDRAVVECLIRIRNGPEFQALREYLERRHQEARESCEALDGTGLYRAQGRAKEARELKELVENATSLYDKVKK